MPSLEMASGSATKKGAMIPNVTIAITRPAPIRREGVASRVRARRNRDGDGEGMSVGVPAVVVIDAPQPRARVRGSITPYSRSTTRFAARTETVMIRNMPCMSE